MTGHRITVREVKNTLGQTEYYGVLYITETCDVGTEPVVVETGRMTTTICCSNVADAYALVKDIKRDLLLGDDND